ncbi:MAG TPA: hypothetical protein VMW80_02730 [Candidatus Dormibacteraeota bacterium]|nr:hypothetical protein [Candidatus Dormibacteraeota bacterium]
MNDHFPDDALSHQLKRVTAEIAATTHLATAPATARLPFADAVKAKRSLRPRYLFGLGGAVALAVVVPLLTLGIFPGNSSALTKVHLPGLTITVRAASHVSPQMTAQQATSVALSYLDHLGSPDFTGYSVTTSVFEPDVTDVTDVQGNCWSHSLPSPVNLWAVEVTAPAQQGFKFIQATVLVDDDSGQESWSMIATNPPTALVPGVNGTPANCQG